MGSTQSSEKGRWMQDKVEHAFSKCREDDEVFVIMASVKQMEELYCGSIDPEIRRKEGPRSVLFNDDKFEDLGIGSRIIERLVSEIDNSEYIIIACKPNSTLQVGDDHVCLGKYRGSATHYSIKEEWYII